MNEMTMQIMVMDHYIINILDILNGQGGLRPRKQRKLNNEILSIEREGQLKTICKISRIISE